MMLRVQNGYADPFLYCGKCTSCGGGMVSVLDCDSGLSVSAWLDSTEGVFFIRPIAEFSFKVSKVK